MDAGTQNLSGAVSNAMRGRAPVLAFAGMSPLTQDGELPGSRLSEPRAAAVTRHECALAGREAAEQPKDGVITAEYLTACVRRLLDGEDALIPTEVLTPGVLERQLTRQRG